MLESEVNEEIQQEVIEDGEIVEVETEELSDDAKAAIDDISVEEEQQVKKEDELEDYSKGVQKRIATLTKKMREQERAANSAYEYAQSLQTENQQLKQSSTQLNKNYLSEAHNRLTSQRAQANAVLKGAYQEQDWDKVTKAQGILDKITVEESKLANSKPVVQQAQPNNYQTYQQPMQQQQQMVQQQAQPDPEAESWADKNEWFGQDETMTLTAFNIHRKLIEEEGFDTSDSTYYDEIDKRIRIEFPHKFSTGDEVKSNSKMQQNVAPAGRSDSSGRKRQVKLSASEVQMAKRLNVPLSEYAKYIKR